MTICKLNRPHYVRRVYGRGIYGRYHKVRLKHGYGLVDSLGKNASKFALSSAGKSLGAYGGKHIGKLIGEKSGNKLLGSVAKSALSALGGLAGEKIGNAAAHLANNTLFENEKKKKKREPEKVSLSQLLDRARSKILPHQGGSGLAIDY